MKRFDMTRFNQNLEEFQQELRALNITGKIVELSNGLVLTDIAEVRKCKRRVMRLQEEYLRRFDNIYSLNRQRSAEAIEEAKSSCSRKGGVACFQKYGERIITHNLTGHGWNKGKTGVMPDPWNKGKSKENDENVRVLLSENRKGERNPCYKRAYTKEEREYRSKLMKQKILSGEFTPNSNNRNTHWNASYDGRRYRSSWEALYQYHNPTAMYEDLRIGYSYNGEHYVYIVDFIDHNQKTVAEVKPAELLTQERMPEKLGALSRWCDHNGYHLIIADQTYLTSLPIPVNIDKFDLKTQSKIRILYETYKKDSHNKA